jgi:mono/diheme cytochrome c family protein
VPTPTVTVAPLPPLDPGMVSQGRRVYAANCASCHGDNARGAPNRQQPNYQGNLPPPPHDASSHTWRHSDEELYGMIRDGWRDPFNKTSELTMPPFRDQLSDQEVRVVITYFKSLWTPEQCHYQWEQSQDEPFPSG